MTLNVKYPYLQDADFLKKIDYQTLQETNVRITVLDWNENPIEEIQGKVSTGSLILSGSSSVRRSGSITVVASSELYNIYDVNNLFSVNKKIQIEIGLTNQVDDDKYKEYRTLWFPQGVFVITDFNIQQNDSGLTLGISIKDKMCLLNGTCGGTLPASVTFNEEEITQDDGSVIIKKVPYYTIIKTLLTDFGQENPERVIIKDVDLKIRQVMRWMGDTSLSLYIDGQEKKYEAYDDVGYIFSDFSPTKDLIGNAGQTVVTILDTIKNQLGNYEYFYDIDGNFIFQEIKNYLNTSKSTEIIESDYLFIPANEKSVYTFTDDITIQSVSNNIPLSNIKNDFVVWGTRETKEGSKLPIRYHLAIDDKPTTRKKRSVLQQKDKDGNINFSRLLDPDNERRVYKESQLLVSGKSIDIKDVPVGRGDTFYTSDKLIFKCKQIARTSKKNGNNFSFTKTIYLDKTKKYLLEASIDHWSFSSGAGLEIDWKKLYGYDGEGQYKEYYDSEAYGILYFDNNVLSLDSITTLSIAENYGGEIEYFTLYEYDKEKDWIEESDNYNFVDFYTQDFRMELYLQGVESDERGSIPNRYYKELKAEWQKSFNIVDYIENDKKLGVKDEQKEDFIYANPDWYLDLIDSTRALKDFSINAIGVRSKTYSSNDVNCLFEKEIPDIILIENNTDSTEYKRWEAVQNGWNYYQISSAAYKQLATGGYQNSAFEDIKNTLYQYTSYNESINFSALPIYYLEPNTRITVNSPDVKISGDYIISTISRPFDANGMMSVQATRALERL